MRVQHNRIEHFHSCQIEQRMDIGECDSLCERLRESVSLGPGPHNALFALPEVLGIIAMLRGAALGDEVTRRLAVIEKEFKALVFCRKLARAQSRRVVPTRSIYQYLVPEAGYSALAFVSIKHRRRAQRRNG